MAALLLLGGRRGQDYWLCRVCGLLLLMSCHRLQQFPSGGPTLPVDLHMQGKDLKGQGIASDVHDTILSSSKQ